jgi:hypothetical protein
VVVSGAHPTVTPWDRMHRTTDALTRVLRGSVVGRPEVGPEVGCIPRNPYPTKRTLDGAVADAGDLPTVPRCDRMHPPSPRSWPIVARRSSSSPTTPDTRRPSDDGGCKTSTRTFPKPADNAGRAYPVNLCRFGNCAVVGRPRD